MAVRVAVGGPLALGSRLGGQAGFRAVAGVDQDVVVGAAEEGRVVGAGVLLLPDDVGEEVGLPEQLVQEVPEVVHLGVVDAGEQEPVRGEQVPGQDQPGQHHVQPVRVAPPGVPPRTPGPAVGIHVGAGRCCRAGRCRSAAPVRRGSPGAVSAPPGCPPRGRCGARRPSPGSPPGAGPGSRPGAPGPGPGPWPCRASPGRRSPPAPGPLVGPRSRCPAHPWSGPSWPRRLLDHDRSLPGNSVRPPSQEARFHVLFLQPSWSDHGPRTRDLDRRQGGAVSLPGRDAEGTGAVHRGALPPGGEGGAGPPGGPGGRGGAPGRARRAGPGGDPQRGRAVRGRAAGPHAPGGTPGVPVPAAVGRGQPGAGAPAGSPGPARGRACGRGRPPGAHPRPEPRLRPAPAAAHEAHRRLFETFQQLAESLRRKWAHLPGEPWVLFKRVLHRPA